MHRWGEPPPSLCGAASRCSHGDSQHAGGQEHGPDHRRPAATQQPQHNRRRLRPALRRDPAPEGCERGQRRGIILPAGLYQGQRPGRQCSQMSSAPGHLLAEESAQRSSREITSPVLESLSSLVVFCEGCIIKEQILFGMEDKF